MRFLMYKMGDESVPFPALTEAERIDGLATVDLAHMTHGATDAVRASTLKDATRVRLWQRVDGPVYLISNDSGLNALHAGNLTSAGIDSKDLSLAIAVDHARRRELDVAHAAFVELADHDQWTVPNGLDLHRPLYRIALNDAHGSELYVSSTTGEVVRDTTRRERTWNYVGSVVHWIYPTALRKHRPAWDLTVWWLSLFATFVAITGVVLGPLQLRIARKRLMSPYRSWHSWHHWLGLSCMVFVFTWILSGWLSMDQGRLFSEGKVTAAEASHIIGAPAWAGLPTAELQRVSAPVKEIEWFSFGGQIFRRERAGLDVQRLFLSSSDHRGPGREFLQPNEVSALARGLAAGCMDAVPVASGDNYALATELPHAPVYRTVCGEVWFHFDGASGRLLAKLDASRRAYRWFYDALHTFDLPGLIARPMLRTLLIVILCAFGLTFSVTGLVIGWRRLRIQSWRATP